MCDVRCVAGGAGVPSPCHPGELTGAWKISLTSYQQIVEKVRIKLNMIHKNVPSAEEFELSTNID